MTKTDFLGVRLEHGRMTKLHELAAELNTSLSAVIRALIDSAQADQIQVGEDYINKCARKSC